MDIFSDLNEAQLTAVTTTEGYVRIVAGAGSGKTKTLTHRYSFLVQAAGIHPGNILCVTFTNKAAGEMKRRVRSLIGDGYDTSLITTYHGFCVRVLREDIGRLFYPQSFPILDESDQKKILEEIYAELEIKLDRASFEKILEKIHYIKSHTEYVPCFVKGDFSSLPDDSLENKIVRMYMQKQKKTFGLDFDDLISFTFEIFANYPEVLSKWQNRLHYIQVDEFQDSSFRELKLISMLSSEHRNLFVVGDPDQNIYEWRGADMSILVDFDKTFPGTETVMLNRNYRSTGNILRAANTVIAKNKNRIPKELYTTGSAGADVIHLHAKTELEEGAFIASEIKKLVKNGECAYRDIAVLYRSGFLSRFVEQSLMAAEVPYELFGSVRFYDRMEIRDSLAYLCIVAYDDDRALERIINIPKRSFGKTRMARLKAIAAKEDISYYSALKKYIDMPDFARTGAPKLVELIENVRGKYRETPLSEIIETVLTESGYEQYIRENGSMERLDNLAEFKRTAVEAERSYGEFCPLEDFLGQAALQSKNDETEDRADRVKLMTIHASKGLEFPACFVCGFTEGIFPSGRTLEERKDQGLEEERRLCFVALTRAMKRLYITESEGSSSAGGASPRQKRPSRFIYEIGEGNYIRIGVIPKELAEQSAPMAEQGKAKGLDIGAEVEHPVFGHGVIQSIDRERGTYGIFFDKSKSVKPVGMDYDFDKWKNLAEMRQNALDAARKNENREPLPHSEEPVPPLPAAESEKKPARVEQTEQSEQLSFDLPEDESSELSAPEEDTETSPEPAEAVEIEIEAIEEPPSANAPKAGSFEALPERYRNADWTKTVDEGEENLWKRSDVPHEGWICEGIYDLGEPVGVCRMCGHQIIRYVHVMSHPSYPRRIGAGCVCAGRMEGDPARARERENRFKAREGRRDTFMKLPLKRSRNGNEYVKYKGEIITVLRDRFREGSYKAVYKNEYTQSHPEKRDALFEVFERIDKDFTE